jgi:hypothetical protein
VIHKNILIFCGMSVAVGILLSSCAKKSCCNATVRNPADYKGLEKELHHETFNIGFSRTEIDRCHVRPVKNIHGATIYIFLDKKIDAKERKYCHVAFSDIDNSKRRQISVTRFVNFSSDECQMLALKCLRPAAHKRLSSKY